MTEKVKKYIPLATLLIPIAALAQTIVSIIGQVASIVSLIVPLLIGIALIVFIWGVIRYITAGGDEAKRAEARNTILYGVIGLFAIIAVWGLVKVLSTTFNIQRGGTIERPQLPA
ncbi:MAG: hypothetical protein AB1643_02615 [Patescibacteria group bacterium]